jgi:signal transduction histidine kinase
MFVAGSRQGSQTPGLRLSTWQRIAAIGGVAAIVLLLGVLTFDGVARTRDARAGVSRTYELLQAAQAVLIDLTNAETGQRGYLITGDERYLAPYHAALDELARDTASLRRLSTADPVQHRLLDSLAMPLHVKLDELATTITTRQTRGQEAAVAEVQSDRGKAAMDNMRAILGQLTARQQALLDDWMEEAESHNRIVDALVIGGTIAAVLLALLLNTLLARYADGQANAARRLDAQNIELADANRQLGEQTLELELQNQQLQEQAVELETQQTHLQEQTAEAEQARVDAEEASKAKTLFLTTMSHELRTPLNAIGGYVDLLAMEIRGPLVEAQREDLRRIKKSGQHLLSLINDILNLAKIESGRLELQLRDVSLASVLDNVDALVSPQFGSKSITYEYPRCDPSLTVRADADKVQQILLNLLSNACKFTDPGGRVTVECDADVPPSGDGQTTVSLRIADTGRGIAEEKLGEIFEPFVQIDRHLTHSSQQGVGLGLAISRDLARSMAGDLTVESATDAGTTFVLTLPRGAVANVAAPAQSEERRST